MLSDLSRVKTPIDDQQLDALTSTVTRGLDPDAFVETVAEIPVGARIRAFEGRLGSSGGRRRIYSAMWDRATRLATTSPEKAHDTFRAATLLSLLDFAATPLQDGIDKLGDPTKAATQYGLEGQDAAALAKLKDELRHSAGLPAGYADFISSLAPVYEVSDQHLSSDRLSRSLRAAEEAWSGTVNLNTRHSIATEVWLLKCLAKGVGDDAALKAIGGTAENLSKASLDPASLKWSKQIMELDGPKPRGPNTKVLQPSDLKPNVPR
jgi:hypothetical protein